MCYWAHYNVQSEKHLEKEVRQTYTDPRQAGLNGVISGKNSSSTLRVKGVSHSLLELVYLTIQDFVISLGPGQPFQAHVALLKHI